ncbi:MAG TPA: hypothetical protein VFD41_11140 [Actinomycetales bacterium]|nr:hypothetical protein [Actinomycetales bacterium]
MMNHSFARRAVPALAATALAGLMAAGPAQAQVYPPVNPGETETAVPPVDVSGTKTSAPADPGDPGVAGDRDDVAVLGVKVGLGSLALTGSDVLPYAAGGAVLLVGGGALVVIARRGSRGEHV